MAQPERRAPLPLKGGGLGGGQPQRWSLRVNEMPFDNQRAELDSSAVSSGPSAYRARRDPHPTLPLSGGGSAPPELRERSDWR